jgi:hypothetical protein
MWRSRRPKGDKQKMEGASRWRPVHKVRSWPRARLAAWETTGGLALSSVTVTLSALNAISGTQAIALALPAMLATIGGTFGLFIPDAWMAWRRGFQYGCNTALRCQAYHVPADVDADALRHIRLAAVVSRPGTHRCGVCGCGLS